MPTAARLVAALAIAAVAFFASEVFKPLMPEGTQLGLLSLINAGWGLVCGWLVLGSRVGQGYSSASGVGIGTSLVLFFGALIGWPVWEMLVKSTRPGAYAGAADAINGAFAVLWDYLVLVGTDNRFSFDVSGIPLFLPQVFVVLVIGGILAGWFAEWAQERAR